MELRGALVKYYICNVCMYISCSLSWRINLGLNAKGPHILIGSWKGYCKSLDDCSHLNIALVAAKALKKLSHFWFTRKMCTKRQYQSILMALDQDPNARSRMPGLNWLHPTEFWWVSPLIRGQISTSISSTNPGTGGGEWGCHGGDHRECCRGITGVGCGRGHRKGHVDCWVRAETQ